MLKELFKDRDKDVQKLIDLIEEIDDEEISIKACDRLLNNHLCEMSAKKKVKEMQPVVLRDEHGNVIHCSLVEYMERMNINSENAQTLIQKEYARANNLGIVSAPRIPEGTTKWDCYWCIAMMFSDYWITVGNSKERAIELAYQFLSDPDREH